MQHHGFMSSRGNYATLRRETSWYSELFILRLPIMHLGKHFILFRMQRLSPMFRVVCRKVVFSWTTKNIQTATLACALCEMCILYILYIPKGLETGSSGECGAGVAQDNPLFIPDGKARIKMEQQAAAHPSRAGWVTFCCLVSDVWRWSQGATGGSPGGSSGPLRGLMVAAFIHKSV